MLESTDNLSCNPYLYLSWRLDEETIGSSAKNFPCPKVSRPIVNSSPLVGLLYYVPSTQRLEQDFFGYEEW